MSHFGRHRYQCTNINNFNFEIIRQEINQFTVTKKLDIIVFSLVYQETICLSTYMDIDVSLSLFIAALDKVCCPLFGKTIFQSNDTGKTFPKQNTVLNFDASCSDKRKDFYRKLNIFRQCKNGVNKQNLIKSRTEYRYTT